MFYGRVAERKSVLNPDDLPVGSRPMVPALHTVPGSASVRAVTGPCRSPDVGGGGPSATCFTVGMVGGLRFVDLEMGSDGGPSLVAV